MDLTNIAKKVQKSMGKKDVAIYVGTELPNVSEDPNDYVVLPSWWKESFGILGLQYGRIVQVAGNSDTGKTSLCLLAIKAAQEQKAVVVFIETEGKTSINDLEASGIEPTRVLLIQNNVTEEAFTIAFEALDAIYEQDAGQKVLFVFDSYGNTMSTHDKNLDMSEGSSRPGGAAKTNRLGVEKLIMRSKQQKLAMLFVNYTYANLGSVGNTNAGGKALDFHSTLTVQTSRKSWINATVKGQQVRKGAVVTWSVFKNHYIRGLRTAEGKPVVLPAKIELSITGEGMKLLGAKETNEEDE